MPTVASLLLADQPKSFVARPVPTLRLTLGGLIGDRHEGALRDADSRTPWHVRGTLIANTRQVSLLSVGDCAEIAQGLGIPSLDPALLGANLVVDGIQGFTQLPIATRLQFPSGATIFVTEENHPCRHPGRKLAEAHGRPELEFDFVKVAMGRRGLVGLVEREGDIHLEDEIRLILPKRVAPTPVLA